MELDESNMSFYFLFKYEINLKELINEISNNIHLLLPRKKELKSIYKNQSTKENQKKKEIVDLLFKIFTSAFESKVYFTDKYYENENEISINTFKELFNFNHLQATRLLNDERTDDYYSISKELLNHFKISDDWNEFKTNIITDIRNGLEKENLNEKVKKHSLLKIDKLLEKVEKFFDYNRGEFSLQTDISDDLILNFLKSIVKTYYEFNNGVKLKEFSQGLGISNLIYMCLKVEQFIKHYKNDVVNLFVIEEPEAHMHPQMERLLIKFIKDLFAGEKDKQVQGIITTHSNEIIKCSNLKNIRVLRIDNKNLLSSRVYDLNEFKQSLEIEDERQFYSFLFSINYSDLIFANKIIMYEGDTEKLYLEKILEDSMFEELSNQYISYVQVGGAYTHWYRKLVYFLGIKTLIITDIDYDRKLTDPNMIKNDSKITNNGLLQYYKDYITKELLDNVLKHCNSKCGRPIKGCINEMNEFERLTAIQLNMRKKPCRRIPKPDYSRLRKKISVNDIYEWKSKEESNAPKLIKIATQTESDGYSRTLEEAMLCKLFNISVNTEKNAKWWSNKIKASKLQLKVPRKDKINVRDIVQYNKDRKTDFMYSIILSNLHIKCLPEYIKKGLLWLK